MDELAARLESLLRLHALVSEQNGADRNRLWEHFRMELRLLVAEFGVRRTAGRGGFIGRASLISNAMRANEDAER